jgi:hypothetical protein
MDKELIVKQIRDALLEYSKIEFKLKPGSPLNPPSETESERVLHRLTSVAERFSPPGTVYRKRLDHFTSLGSIEYRITHIAGLLSALAEEYELEYLQTLQELIHADTFSDFLDMATYLLQQGYKDPAAVVAGSVLEHRDLCKKNSVALLDAKGNPKKAEMMNQDLYSANVYNLLNQKSVTAWLDLRNKAAHGHYAEYDAKQVSSLIDNIRNFMARLPA